MSWHIAETRKKAREQAGEGLLRWHNEYTVGTLMRPGAEAFDNPKAALEGMAGGEQAASVVGTPDDLIEAIQKMIKLTDGFGTVISFAHDWANPRDTFNSYDLVARYVVPEVNGLLDSYRESQKHVIENRDVFERAGEAVVSKIMENERAAEAMMQDANAASAMQSPNAPDLKKVATKNKNT